MDIIIYPLIEILLLALRVIELALIVYAVITLLIQFNVLNRGNQFVNVVYSFLKRFIHPTVKKIQKIVPLLGGIDFSILILFVCVYFIHLMLERILMNYFIPSYMYKIFS